MCLIDEQGREVSRIVGNQIAHDLAHDESDADFFAPGFALGSRQVHIAPLYLSPDADMWVMAYVTPIFGDGRKPAILHYEHDLRAYQHALDRHMVNRNEILLAVDSNGLVIYDSRHPIDIHGRVGVTSPDAYFQRFELAGMTLSDLASFLGTGQERGAGALTIADRTYEVAYRSIHDWTIIAIAAQ